MRALFPSDAAFPFDNASAAKGVASVGRFVLHASIRFLRPIDLPAVGKRDKYTIADSLSVFAFKGENVGQESLYARIGHGRLRSPQSRKISRRSASYTTCRSLLSTRPGSGQAFHR
jgi:hypothetical protein